MDGTSLLALSAIARPFLPRERDIFLKRLEVAQILRVSPYTLARWAKAGVGPTPLRIGGILRYRLSDVRSCARPAA